MSETTETLLRRQADLVTVMRGVLTMEPNMSATRFQAWFAEVQGDRRLVGGLGATVVEPVTPRALSAFEARRNADPAFRAYVGNTRVDIIPSGRSRYCLLSAGASVVPFTNEVSELIQGDWCNPASPIGGFDDGGVSQAVLAQSITDSGQFSAYPVNLQGVSALFIEAAFYRRGAPLGNVMQRRAALAGWVGSSFDVGAVVRDAIGDHRDVSVALYHRNQGRPEREVDRVGPAGIADALTHETSLQIDGVWRLVVRGSGAATGLSANVQGLALFVVGAIISLLLFVLIGVLTRARAHALRTVEEKTGQLRHQALHDSLTGLPNRALAIDRAEQLLARTRRESSRAAALYIDLDGFKSVNDTYGHAAGDELLKMVASRLEVTVRESDTAARFGGDEFVVLSDTATLDTGPELVAERILEVLREPYEIQGRKVSLTPSIGVAIGARASADELLRDADIALYEAKACGGNCYTIFQSEMHTVVHERLTLQMDLGEALARKQLLLMYQPTIDLRTEAMTGVEALIRWQHPTRGLMSPETFIPLAEESGQIVAIGRWVLQEACRQAAAWNDEGHEINVAVNVSGRQLDSDTLMEDVQRALGDSGLRPDLLTLEVTETVLMRDTTASAERLHKLKQLGVLIAIDDFGTGYSSLAYLQQFPADRLKIDRSFINTSDPSGSAALIHTLVQLSNALHIATVAEGIEEPEQLALVRREHCDYGQGYLFARPLAPDALEKLFPGVQTPRNGTREARPLARAAEDSLS